MKNILYIVLNITLIFFINCGADPVSSGDGSAGVDSDFVGLYIEHQQNY